MGAEDFGIERKYKQYVMKNGFSSLKEARRIAERNLAGNALSHYRGGVSRAAHEFGVRRPALYTLMKKHKLQM